MTGVAAQGAAAAAAAVANAGEEQRQQLLHILMVPFESQGHINAMLSLAHALASEKGVLVTFGYPARFHSLARKRTHKLDSAASAQMSNSMSLRVEVLDDGLSLEEDQGLPHDFRQSTFPIFYGAVKRLLDDLLQKGTPPHCIISDTFTAWTQDLADAAGIPRADFWTSTAATFSMGIRLSVLVAKGILPLPKSCWLSSKKWSVEGAPLIEGVPGLPPFPATDLPVEFVHPEEVSDSNLQFMLANFGRAKEAHTILIHSVYELESQVFDALQASGFPVHAVGPLPDPALKSSVSSTQAQVAAKHECIQWLDKQPPSSVVYVALGSIAKLSSGEMHALAHGLEASGHHFLWVIRRDAISGAISEALPEGFLQRTVEKDLGLISSWAPQAEVLCHRALGAFFSHCGWNSTAECIWEGIPMVACPQEAEQRSNARWIVEHWKMGVELERQVDGSFTKEAVERALKEVLGKNGPTYKQFAFHCKEVARSAIQKGGTSHANLVGFLQCLRQSSSRS